MFFPWSTKRGSSSFLVLLVLDPVLHVAVKVQLPSRVGFGLKYSKLLEQDRHSFKKL